MAVVPLDGPAARAAIDDAARRISAILSDAADIDKPIAGLDWTAAETASHLVCVLSGFADAVSSQQRRWAVPEPEDANFHTRLAAGNAAMLAQIECRDPANR